MHKAKQSKILSCFKPSPFTTADYKPQLVTLRQADTTGVYISSLPALMNSEGKMSIDNPPLFPVPQYLVPPTILTSDGSA